MKYAKYKISTFNQPDGIGGGWARCHARLKDPTKRYAISRPDGSIVAWRRTHNDAKAVVEVFAENARALMEAARAMHCKD